MSRPTKGKGILRVSSGNPATVTFDDKTTLKHEWRTEEEYQALKAATHLVYVRGAGMCPFRGGEYWSPVRDTE